MGVPKLRPAIIKYFVDTNIEVKPNQVGRCTGLYIDGNTIIHTAIQVNTDGQPRKMAITADDFEECADQVIRNLLIVTQHYSPSELLYIAIDGVPPMAKVKQQKERRYAAAMLRKKGAYDSNIVSPGTEFMMYLDKKIRDNIINKKNAYGVNQAVYSSHLVPGEGEHKIMNYIRTNVTIKGTTVIYGNDADLIILGLALGNEKVFICGDTVQLYTIDNKPIPMQFNKPVKKPISIDNLRKGIFEELGADREEDFIFTMSLLGNDFLPRSPILSDVEEAFNFIMESLKSYDATSYQNIEGLFGRLARRESFDNPDAPSLLTLRQKYLQRSIDKNTGYVKFDSAIFDAMLKKPKDKDSVPLFRQLWYTKCFSRVPFTHETSPVLLNMCMEYLRGMHWVKDYYMYGHDDVTWLWMYPYNHAPLFEDLLSVILNRDLISGFKSSCSNLAPDKDEIRFTSLHLLVAIMPVQSYDCISEDLYQFYTMRGGMLHLMPSVGITLDREFTEMEHQQRPILPLPNYTEIMTGLGAVRLRTTLLKKHERENEYSLSGEPGYRNILAENIVKKIELSSRDRDTGIRERSSYVSADRGGYRGRGGDRGGYRGRGRGRGGNDELPRRGRGKPMLY